MSDTSSREECPRPAMDDALVHPVIPHSVRSATNWGQIVNLGTRVASAHVCRLPTSMMGSALPDGKTPD